MKPKALKLKVPDAHTVSALLDCPRDAVALLTLAHGAGAGMNHSSMKALAEALNAQGIATLRFQFPYMEKGSKRPDRPDLAARTIASALHTAKLKSKLPLFVGGKSFGGRMTTTAASQKMLEGARGIICFSFPLHPPKKPSVSRADHISDVTIPMLWIQGTKDDLSDLSLVKNVAKKNRTHLRLHLIQEADHSYHVLKRSGRTDTDVLKEVASTTRQFCDDYLKE